MTEQHLGEQEPTARPLTQAELTRLGTAAAHAIKQNLPADAFGDARRLDNYADIWGAAARTAVLACLIEIQEARNA